MVVVVAFGMDEMLFAKRGGGGSGGLYVSEDFRAMAFYSAVCLQRGLDFYPFAGWSTPYVRGSTSARWYVMHIFYPDRYTSGEWISTHITFIKRKPTLYVDERISPFGKSDSCPLCASSCGVWRTVIDPSSGYPLRGWTRVLSRTRRF